MIKATKKKEIGFFQEFERFIKESGNGRRLQPNGKRISAGTVVNYKYTLQLIRKFCEKRKFNLRIIPSRMLNNKESKVERNYWKKFYRLFNVYMYDDCGYFDNYVGQNMKNIKTFFNYLNKQRGVATGNFHAQFYVRKEEVAIFPLMPAELSYLINNLEFEESLDQKMKQVKDFFVFGCTVALRFSDLKALKKSNIRQANNQYYLVVNSIKTSVETVMRLPLYAVSIVKRYLKIKKHLLPQFSLTYMNKHIKILLEKAGFTQDVRISRNQRGNAIELKPGRGDKKSIRFCDVASSHCMRRTAITTLLSLGVAEQIVRKISGHTANSKEFYRYVFWSQVYQDHETEKVFNELEKMGSSIEAAKKLDQHIKKSPLLDSNQFN
jgi:integrase